MVRRAWAHLGLALVGVWITVAPGAHAGDARAPAGAIGLAQYQPVAHGGGAAGALVVDCRDGRPALLGVLHVQGDRLVFSLPGGRSEPRETPVETALRETREETGYAVTAVKRLQEIPNADPGFAVVLARIESPRGRGRAFDEVLSALWIDPRRIPPGAWRFPGDREWVVPLFERYAPAQCG